MFGRYCYQVSEGYTSPYTADCNETFGSENVIEFTDLDIHAAQSQFVMFAPFSPLFELSFSFSMGQDQWTGQSYILAGFTRSLCRR